MVRAYSDDLRCKFLEAYEAGSGSLRELAQQFRVSWGYAKKIRRQQLQTGQKQRLPQARYGPVSRLTATVRQQMFAWLQEQPDLTNAELRDRLQGIGVTVSESRLVQVRRELKSLGKSEQSSS